MEDKNKEVATYNTDKDYFKLMKTLLAQGILVCSTTNLGSIILGPAGGILGAGAGALLSWVRQSGLGSASPAGWLSSLSSNPLVGWALSIISTILVGWGTGERLWKALLRLAEFLQKLTQSGPKPLANTPREKY